MRVICPLCGEVVPGADIDPRRGLAVCRPCSEVVPLPTSARDAEGSATFIAREVAALPLHGYCPDDLAFQETRSGQRFLFVITPSRVVGVAVIVFAVIWLSFIYEWFAFAAGSGKSSLGPLAYWFPLLHAGAGLVFLHTAVCMLVNHAEITLTPLRFTYLNKPLWQPGAVSQPFRNLRAAVDLEEVARGGKDRWFKRTVTFSVQLLLRDNRSVTLNLNLPERGQARYVALRLNRAIDELRAAGVPDSAQPLASHSAAGDNAP